MTKTAVLQPVSHPPTQHNKTTPAKMSDPDEAENEAAAAEVPKKVATVKKKKTPAKKKPAAPVVAVAQGVTASDEADEVPPPAPPPPKKAPKGKGKTPGKKAPPPSPRTPPPPPPPIITSDDANEPPPPSPAPKKTKKVPSSSNEAAVAAAAEEGVEGGEVEKAHPKKTPAKKATTTTTTTTTTPQVEKRPAPKTPLAKKTTNSNDTGQSPIQQSDGTATLTAGNAQQPQQLLTVDNGQMTATLKRRGIVLKKPLHQGRHSVIYRAEMSSGPVPGTPTITATTPVAVRVLFLDKIKQRDAIRLRQKFLPREIAALCSVHHDGLVTVHEVVRTGARVAIVMELLRDGTLTDYLTENGPFPTEAGAAPWFIEVTRALEYLHEECRLAHRNVKTDNIFLNGGHVKLSLAAFPVDAWDWEEGRPVLSRTMCGTHQYKCPQLARNLPYDPYAADCWALGVVLFQLLNGRYPFSAANSEKEAMVAQQTDPGHLDRVLLRRNFSQELLRLLKEGLFVEEEKSRLTARQVLKHPWVRKFSVGGGGGGGGGGGVPAPGKKASP